MKEIELNKTKVFTAPSTANKITITHEWGDIEINAAAVTGTSYSFMPTSIGVHKLEWFNNTTKLKTEHYDAVLSFTSASEFFGEYPELESEEDRFTAKERIIRRVIESYTQQKFGPLLNKTLTLEGQGSDELALPNRLLKLISVEDNIGTIFTDIVERSPNSEYFIQRKSDYIGGRFTRASYWDEDIKREVTRDIYNLFSARYNYIVTGNWGWDYVPIDVSDAAKILIADELNAANELRKQGFTEGQLGDFSYRLAAEYTSTTGNTQADLLLAPYVVVNIGLI